VVRVRLTISRKFVAVLAVLVPLIVAIALAGVRGVASMNSEFDQVFTDNVHVSQVSTSLGADLSHAEELALRSTAKTNGRNRTEIAVANSSSQSEQPAL